ncbi:glycosyltransferase [Catalinimonas niigatensis]|uniref:glycosyltransferase n=1 Tax=Catalinimonas niigatensis TaxID=1397264 RepID=UPI002666CE26|nr:glycosyltransferase [Catalinimonas niigatensis]WPP52178.1 glycosyltransferase [Catalinimonas niigatensis]
MNTHTDPESPYTLKNKSLPEPVSVIVCAHNEKENLMRLLPRLYAQNFKRFEIVIVNDRSTDGTIDFLLEEQNQHPNLKVVWVRSRPQHIKGKKYALTLGIRAASHDKLLLTDADCLPDTNDWIRGMSATLDSAALDMLDHTANTLKNEEKTFALGYSPYEKQRGLLNAFIRYETLHTAALYFSAALAGKPYMGVGRNLAYRKSFFMQKKGFHRYLSVMGGDDDLFVNEHATSSNVAISMDTRTQVHSKPKTSLKEYYRQKKRHLGVGKYYKEFDKKWLGAFSFSHILFWMGFIVLILAGTEPYFVISGLLTRGFMQFLFLKTAGRKLNDPINLALLPILDFLYVIYYIVLGISAVSSNNTRWS